jgi:manganese oxidase
MKLQHTFAPLGRLAGLAGVAAALLAPAAQAAVPGLTGPNFNLEAKPGFISAADGISIYNWGYSVAGAANIMQFPGPTLIATQGATVSVTLTNSLPMRTSIVFPGQSNVTCAPVAQCIVSPGAAAPEVNPGATVTYSFVAANPGTYTYHSGTQMDVQVEMGMFGALVVRPTGQPTWAYGNSSTAFTPGREYLLMLSEIDAVRHQAVFDQVQAGLPGGRVNTSAFASYTPRYWFINGRNAPDTLASAGAPALPAQPYNSLVQMHPGDDVLLRVINMGRDLHPFHHHGNNTWTIARDGRLLRSSAAATTPDVAQSDFTLRMIPGQTVDAIWRWSGVGLNWDMYGDTCDLAQPVSQTNCRSGKYNAAGVQTAAPAINPRTSAPYRLTQLPGASGDLYKPIPARLPFELELTYGEMYSGSPFLGGTGKKPVGAGLANTSSGYFHMMHSHNEKEIINDGVFPGGMMTMVLIQPPNVAIAITD